MTNSTSEPTIQWDDKKYNGLIGDTEVEVCATGKEPTPEAAESSMCVLFRYCGREGDAANNIYALRWSLGAVLDLGTDDVAMAKGSVETMILMEESDNDAE
tara:strand:- start:909 stop:1211 length:303 start_codon:yes stop_codon:yes gene_type:complete